ncbi:MAG: hypothetical protein V4519_02230 [Patescibacteria group bacterium]
MPPMKFEGASYDDEGNKQEDTSKDKKIEPGEYPMSTFEEVTDVMVHRCSPIILQTRHIHPNIIVEQIKLAGTYSTKQIVEILNNSTSLDWNMKPGFYKALALEIAERVRRNKLR